MGLGAQYLGRFTRLAKLISLACLFRRSNAFPLNQLHIAIGLIALVALGLYFFAGAWGVFLLWGLAMVLVLPQVGAVFALIMFNRE